jgi:TRAP transporter TAXI family solute receptor
MDTPNGHKPTPPPPEGRGKHALMVWGTILVVCLAALVGTYLLFVKAPPPNKLVIAAGGKTGAYYPIAQQYAEELQKEGIAVEVRETGGSGDNLKLLDDDGSGVSVAIVQSGVAGPDEGKKLQALGSLYREPLWVFYRDDKPIDLLSQLAGKRVGVGNPGSGTYAIAVKLLEANGLEKPKDKDPAKPEEAAAPGGTWNEDKVAVAAEKLQKGELDAAFMVAGYDAKYVQDLLKDPNVRLMSFAQHEAYHRTYRFLSQLTVPAGLVDLGSNLPRQDISLLAPTAMLVAHKDLHPALVPVLLTAATHVHGKGDKLSNPGEFPSASYTDLPVGEDAEMFYKSGPPFLQKFLPFWLASLVDRLKVMLVPLVVLLWPLLRAAPPLVRWRTRRKIYLWYTALRDIDKKIELGLSGAPLDAEVARLRDINQQVAHVEVPLSYMEEFYHLRLHLKMLQEQLENMRARQGAGEERGAAGGPRLESALPGAG